MEEKKEKGIFQQYNFEFTSERLGKVLENISPDMVIFMGLQDEHLNKKEDYVKYISGLVSVITSAKSAGVKNFSYISSMNLYFEGTEKTDLKEDGNIKVRTLMGKANLEGEKLCEFYQVQEEFEIKIARIPEIYGYFGNQYSKNSILEKHLSTCINEGKIYIKDEKNHPLIELNDAIEACYSILFKTEEEDEPTFIVPFEQYTDAMVANMIKNKVADSIDIVGTSSDEIKPVIIEPGRLEQSGFYLKSNLEDSIEDNYEFVKSHMELKEKHKKIDLQKGRWIYRLIENVLLFVIAYLLTMITDSTWVGNIVNFYIIYVVLIAVTHGMAQTILASVLSIIGHISFIISKDGIGTILGNYDPYVWVLQLLAIGTLVAYMRDKYKVGLRDAKEDVKYLDEELEEMKDINDSNVYIKNIYEKRLVSYKNSLSRLYEVTSELDFLEPQKVIFQAANVISRLMECEDVAIYIGNGKSKYYRLAATTSDYAMKLGKSFSLEEKSEIFDALNDKDIFRNNSLSEDMPLLAGATYNENMITTIIMVWTDNLETANIYQVNLLAILCRLIEKSTVRAYDFMEALMDESFYGKTTIMKKDAFEKRLAIYKEGKEQGLLDFSVLDLKLTENKKYELAMASKLVRDTDYIGLVGKKAKILLSSTSKNEADAVIERFRSKDLQIELEA